MPEHSESHSTFEGHKIEKQSYPNPTSVSTESGTSIKPGLFYSCIRKAMVSQH